MVQAGNIADDVVAAVASINKRDMRFAVIKVDEATAAVTLESTGERDATIDDCRAKLPADEPRYVIFDYHLVRGDGVAQDKVVFVCYSPDSCKVMAKKFALQEYKAAVRAKVSNVFKDMQVNDINDFSEAEFADSF